MGLIPNEIISAVLERSDIVALIGRYVQLKKAGRNYKALCPFHPEKTPSFVVNPDKQIFHCFGCGVGGNAVGFVMRQERLEFPQAVRLLAEQCGIQIPEAESAEQSPSRKLREDVLQANQLAADYFHDLLLTDRSPAAKAARDYLKGRGVSLEAVQQFKLGFAADDWEELTRFLKGKGLDEDLMLQAGLVIARENRRGVYDRFRNRVIFPIFDISGRPVAFGARALSEQEGQPGAKYINSPETPVYTKGRHLYGFHLTRASVGQQDAAIVVEGYVDMIMPFVHGVTNIVASLGTALTVDQIRLIRRYTPKVVMLFDTDPAGQNAIVRSLDLLIDEGMDVRVAVLSPGQDPDSFIRAHGVDAFQSHLNQALSLFDFKLNWLKSQHNAHTVEGKAAICQHMLATISRFGNEVVKSELSKKLSDDLVVDLSAVMKELKAIKPPAVDAKPTPQVAAPSLSLNDEIFLGLLLSDRQWAQKARDEIAPEDFAHPLMRGIVEQILSLAQESVSWAVGDLFSRLPNEASQALVSRVASREEAWLGEKEQVFQDCVSKLRKKRLERKLEEVKRSGDLQQVDEILRQIKS